MRPLVRIITGNKSGNHISTVVVHFCVMTAILSTPDADSTLPSVRYSSFQGVWEEIGR